MAKSLSSKIGDLITAFGNKPRPDDGAIKSDLIQIRTLAETLENGQSTRETESQIATLQAERDNLKAALTAANAEIDRFRAEQAKREKEDAEMPPEQFRILKTLPSEHSGGWLRVNEISDAVQLPVDEAEIHLDRLHKAGLAIGRFNAWDAVVWHRTMRGNEYILAKRLAGDEK